MVDTSKEIQNELLDYILPICQDNIMEEIKTAKYVSLMRTKLQTSHLVQLDIVFRYVLPNGQPVERFCKFDNTQGRLSTRSLLPMFMSTSLECFAGPRKTGLSKL